MTEAYLTFLKRQLKESEDFKDTFQYFLKHFAHNSQFLRMGEPIMSIPTKLAMVLKGVGRRVFRKKRSRLRDEFLLEVQMGDHEFIHGTCSLHGKTVNLFYFEDIDLGMIGLMNKGKHTKYIRFSSTELNMKAHVLPFKMGIPYHQVACLI